MSFVKVIKSLLKRIFYYFVNIYYGVYNRIKKTEKETSDIRIVQYKDKDGKEVKNFFFKAKDHYYKNVLHFPGFGPGGERSWTHNIPILPPGREANVNEYIFQLLKQNPQINHLQGHSNGCNNLITALEYIIKQSTNYRMKNESYDVWQKASPEEKDRMTDAQRILNNLQSIELSKPYPHIGAPCGPWIHRVARAIVSLGQSDDAEGYASNKPIHYRANNVLHAIRQQNEKCELNVFHGEYDPHCGGYNFHKNYEEEYNKKHPDNIANKKENIINIYELKNDYTHATFFADSMTSSFYTNIIPVARNNNITNEKKIHDHEGIPKKTEEKKINKMNPKDPSNLSNKIEI